MNKYLQINNYIDKLADNFRWILQKPISLFEHHYLYHRLTESENDQPVFIIGAPRTGSTILYQALTNTYDLTYIDNLASKWHRNLLFGAWLSDKKFKGRPHNNFKAKHGNTGQYGKRAPNECGQFWYRWLPRDRHFIDYKDIDASCVDEIRHSVNAVIQYFGKPILFKNLNAGQRLRLLQQAFPNAKFIYLRRDPRFIVRSIMTARKRANVNQKQWWSVKPANFETLLSLPEPEMCAAQVFYLEQQIEEDLKLFPKENVREVHFQQLSEDMICSLGEWIGVSKRLLGTMPTFKKDHLNALDVDELKRLEVTINKYPFGNSVFI
ncbi:hypothetical protein imdm_491 [gamma proteobacterium IMCC2047]|nr:hypothetical protein imdm_491 [gamma proteobacterium IMCC2047]